MWVWIDYYGECVWQSVDWRQFAMWAEQLIDISEKGLAAVAEARQWISDNA